MKLKDFVKLAIKDISEAINEANSELDESGAVVNPSRVVVNSGERQSPIYGYMLDDDEKDLYRKPVHIIDFDVAVTVTEKEGKSGGIGIKVASFGAGVNGNNETANSTNSRLSFKIPVSFPTGK